MQLREMGGVCVFVCVGGLRCRWLDFLAVLGDGKKREGQYGMGLTLLTTTRRRMAGGVGGKGKSKSSMP